MKELPFVLHENEHFFLIYKPPYYAMTIDTENYPKQIPIANKIDLEKFSSMASKLDNTKILALPPFLGKTLGTINVIEFGICHRYDIDTSGGVFIAKSDEWWYKLRDILSNKTTAGTYKIYVCLVNGKVEKENGFIKDSISVTSMGKPSLSKDGRRACSYYQVKAILKDKYDNYYSLVIVRIYSGLTHQIRLHMLSIGHPLVSDRNYITDPKLLKENKEISGRTFLHNFFLAITMFNKIKKFRIPIPFDLMSGIYKLKTISGSISGMYVIPPNMLQNCEF